MIYGVEQSTDLRDRRTKIKKFTSLRSALKWASSSGGFTHDNPEEARNYHRTFRELYELNGKVNYKDKIFTNNGTPTYPCSKEDNLAMYLYAYAEEIKRN